MNTHRKTDLWIFYLVIVLGLSVTASVVGSITLFLLDHTIPDVLLALGVVAGACFVNLLISPLNRELIWMIGKDPPSSITLPIDSMMEIRPNLRLKRQTAYLDLLSGDCAWFNRRGQYHCIDYDGPINPGSHGYARFGISRWH